MRWWRRCLRCCSPSPPPSSSRAWPIPATLPGRSAASLPAPRTVACRSAATPGAIGMIPAMPQIVFHPRRRHGRLDLVELQQARGAAACRRRCRAGRARWTLRSITLEEVSDHTLVTIELGRLRPCPAPGGRSAARRWWRASPACASSFQPDASASWCRSSACAIQPRPASPQNRLIHRAAGRRGAGRGEHSAG